MMLFLKPGPYTLYFVFPYVIYIVLSAYFFANFDQYRNISLRLRAWGIFFLGVMLFYWIVMPECKVTNCFNAPAKLPKM